MGEEKKAGSSPAAKRQEAGLAGGLDPLFFGTLWRMGISRRPFVGGNWKMNTDLASAVELADDVVAACGGFADRCDIALYPPFPYLQVVGRTLGHHGPLRGAQDV